MRSIEVGHRGLLLSQIYVLKCQQQQSVSQKADIPPHWQNGRQLVCHLCPTDVTDLSVCVFVCARLCVCFYSQLMPTDSGVGATAAPLSGTGMRKAWHEHVTQDLRNHLVHKLWVPHFSCPSPPLPCACILKTCVLQVCVGFGFGCVEAESQHKYPPPSPAHLSWKPKPSIHSLLHLQIL